MDSDDRVTSPERHATGRWYTLGVSGLGEKAIWYCICTRRTHVEQLYMDYRYRCKTTWNIKIGDIKTV